MGVANTVMAEGEELLQTSDEDEDLEEAADEEEEYKSSSYSKRTCCSSVLGKQCIYHNLSVYI